MSASIRTAALLLVCIALGFVGFSHADAAESPASVRAQIAAGEFSSAVDAAQRLPAADRDGALREVAEAQRRAGAVEAATSTVATIRDDALRGEILGQMFGGGADPFGGGGQGATGGGAPMLNLAGALGGGVQPDFESLMDLMTSTIAPETWRAAGGTQGEVRPHHSGVLVDAQGEVRPIVNSAEVARLAALRRDAARAASEPSAVRRSSALRKVSLTRLERELQIRAARGLPVEEELHALAGLQKIQYVFVYPESGDVVLAGPAGDWYFGRENRPLAVETDRPVVLLDDLVTLLRREFTSGGSFGCSIDPTPTGLEQLTAFVTESAKRPLPVGGRPKWTEELGRRLGTQVVSMHGIDPTSRAASVIVEADYRMKLLGVGKEESIPAVPDYLKLVADTKAGKPPGLDLVRWWFTVDYDTVLTSPDHDVYELRGQGVKLLSENEFLAGQGQRVSTGQATDPNRAFAANFTQHYAALGQKYPIYADMQNIFDLAVVCSVLRQDAVCDRIGWRRSGLMSPQVFATSTGAAPTKVDTVAQSRELSKTLVIATASGGVTVDVAGIARPDALQIDSREQLAKVRRSQRPAIVPDRGWWWD
ncbi:MAG: DUF1598 domain-containing protein [Planctomycetes bacterium]|nr:DUF1598 domain-containing protein [Planctomycetota bacterium]